jgi:hypothetical protein
MTRTEELRCGALYRQKVVGKSRVLVPLAAGTVESNLRHRDTYIPMFVQW